jgi:hypothetical protein
MLPISPNTSCPNISSTTTSPALSGNWIPTYVN